LEALPKELGIKPKRKKGDDEMTEENNEDDYPVDNQYNLDEK